MRQIRTESSRSPRSADRVTVHARGRFENVLACALVLVAYGLLLRENPILECFGAVHRHLEKHLRVLRAAILRTLSQIDSRALRVHPHFIYPVRDQVRFPSKLWYPEAVIGIGRKQFQEGGLGMRRVTDGNVQFVRGDDTERRISELPPELMPNDSYFHRRGRFRSILDRVDHTCR